MLRVRRAQPRLEALENRYTPATIKLVSGNLFISNLAGGLGATGLEVKALSPTKFMITDNGKGTTVSGVGGLISITGSNKSNLINVDTNGFKFGGNPLINSGNGNDDILIQDDTVTTGSVKGNVTVLTGLGNDDIDVEDVDIGGSFTAADTAGFDTLEVLRNDNDLVDTVGGNVTATGYNTINVGDPGAIDQIGGTVSLTTVNDGSDITVIIATDLLISKNLNVTGSNGPADSFNLGGATIGGNVTVSLGNGPQNDFNLSTDGTATVGGNVSMTSNSGIGNITNSSDLVINGNLNAYLGNGDYVLGFGGAPFTVAGNVYINAGNGDQVGWFIAGSIAGNLTVNFGNGTNDLQVFNGPGGVFTFRGGNGGNKLTLGDGSAASGNFNVNIRFGSGIDELVVDINDANVLNGLIDFDGDDGTGDIFTLTSGTLSPNLVIVDLP